MKPFTYSTVYYIVYCYLLPYTCTLYKKWSSQKLLLNRGLLLFCMLLNRGSTVKAINRLYCNRTRSSCLHTYMHTHTHSTSPEGDEKLKSERQQQHNNNKGGTVHVRGSLGGSLRRAVRGSLRRAVRGSLRRAVLCSDLGGPKLSGVTPAQF